MKPSELKEYFKTGYAFGKKTGMSPMSFSYWLKWGYIPFSSQKKIESLTGGDLIAIWEDSDERKAS